MRPAPYKPQSPKPNQRSPLKKGYPDYKRQHNPSQQREFISYLFLSRYFNRKEGYLPGKEPVYREAVELMVNWEPSLRKCKATLAANLMRLVEEDNSSREEWAETLQQAKQYSDDQDLLSYFNRKSGPIVEIQSRLHEQDIPGVILDDSNGFSFPTRYEDGK